MSYEWLDNPPVHIQEVGNTAQPQHYYTFEAPQQNLSPQPPFQNIDRTQYFSSPPPPPPRQTLYNYQTNQQGAPQPHALPSRVVYNQNSQVQATQDYTSNRTETAHINHQFNNTHHRGSEPQNTLPTFQPNYNIDVNKTGSYFLNTDQKSQNQTLNGKNLNPNNPFRKNNQNTQNYARNDFTTVANSPGSDISHTLSRTKSDSHSNSEPNLVNLFNNAPGSFNLPLALSSYQLSLDESKTYLRWYYSISKRKNFKGYITLTDVFRFLKNNFKLTEDIKQTVTKIFLKIKERIGIDNFYAVLRLISNLLVKGQVPTKDMLLVVAPVLKPKSILCQGEKEEIYEEVEDSQDDQPFDFDNFTSLLLTGKSHRVKRVIKRADNRPPKNVRFSDKLETFQEDQVEEPEHADQENLLSHTGQSSTQVGGLDPSLPMDQLLKRLQDSRQQESAEEKEELADMKESLTHFKNLPKIDSVSLGLPNRSVSNDIEPLKPTATGSANHLFGQQPLRPTATGSANRLFGNNSYTQQDNGSYSSFTEPLKPTATGSANYLFSQQNKIQFNNNNNNNNLSQNNNEPVTSFGSFQPMQVLKPTATGSANFYMKHSESYLQNHQPPANNNLQPNNFTASPASEPYSNSIPVFSPSTTGGPIAQNNSSEAANFGRNTTGMNPQPQGLPGNENGINKNVADYFNMLLHHDGKPQSTGSHQPANVGVHQYSNMQQQNTEPMNYQQSLNIQTSTNAYQQFPSNMFGSGTQRNTQNNSSSSILNDFSNLQNQIDNIQNMYDST